MATSIISLNNDSHDGSARHSWWTTMARPTGSSRAIEEGDGVSIDVEALKPQLERTCRHRIEFGSDLRTARRKRDVKHSRVEGSMRVVL